MSLIRDIKFALTKNKASVLMYPEAAYTYDGTNWIKGEQFVDNISSIIPDRAVKAVKIVIKRRINP